MIHWNLIRRELTRAAQQSLIFMLCVALALVTLTGLNSFGETVRQALLNDARQLQAGDVIVKSPQMPSPPVAAAIDALLQQGIAESTLVRRFFTVARLFENDDSLLTELKVVEPNYPFYGEVELGSGRPLKEVLKSGTVIVEPRILDRLQLAVGDSIRLGNAVLTIGDILVHDPTQPVNFFAFGPRILVASADLDRLDLIKPGSRVRYRTLLKINDAEQLNAVTNRLRAASDNELESVNNYRTARSGIQRFFENLLFFLSLVAVFIVILAGIGIQSALTAFLRERDNTVAIIKTLGATNRFVTVHFFIVLLALAAGGTVLGLLGGLLLQQLLPLLLADFMPADVTLSLSWRVLLESILASAAVVGIFAFLPLDRLKELRPSFILRRETIPVPRDLLFYLVLLLLILLFAGMVFWQLKQLRQSFYFLGGTLVLLAVILGITETILLVLRKTPVRRLDLRQALRGLFRPRNATRSIIISLAASLAVVFSIYLIEQNLVSAFVSAYPPDAPNVIFLDIQQDQRDTFRETVKAEAGDVLQSEPVLFPVVRGHIVSINGEKLDRAAARRRRGDNLARQFNLSYYEELLETESLVVGESLFDPNFEGAQVSVLDDVLEMRELTIGDQLEMRIQGVPLEATVTSIRTRTSQSPAPFFYFVFQPQVLSSAPQTTFTALRVPPDRIAQLQNRVVARIPNVSVIDVTKAVAALADITSRLSSVIRLLAGFSIAAGLLIIVSSIYATRFARTQEAVYYKILGAQRRFVLRVFALENLILGLIAALVALLPSHLGSWVVCHWVFEIEYDPFLRETGLLIVATVLLVIAVGLAASVTILRKRPIAFLRDQSPE